MTHPIFHSETSVRLWGGRIEDYLALHEFLDQTKLVFADFRHRALRHHSQGIFEGERVFGTAITNSDGHLVPVRYILEAHCREDCGGKIPTVCDWFRSIVPEAWMSRGHRVGGTTPIRPQPRSKIWVPECAGSRGPE